MHAAGLDSLGRLLVSRLGTAWEAGRPITVKDLVDTLIPYHHVRGALDLTMKGEYDLGILHLLHSGEHLRVDAELAQAVERELATPEPDLDFLSDVAESRVEVRPEAWAHWSAGMEAELRGGGMGPGDPTTPNDGTHAAEVPTAEPLATGPRAAEPRAAEPRAAEPPKEEGRPTAGSIGAPVDRLRDRLALTREHERKETRGRGSLQSSGPARAKRDGATTSSERCRHCQRILPERSDLQFCPYCGSGQADPACAECDEPLERGWAYCPRCGKATKS